jgi:hypothetical protein
VRLRNRVTFVWIPDVREAIRRVRQRVIEGGHDVTADDIRRRFVRSIQHFVDDYAPLADRWALWDNSPPPAKLLANSGTHSIVDLRNFFVEQWKIRETGSDQSLKGKCRNGRVSRHRLTSAPRERGAPNFAVVDCQWLSGRTGRFAKFRPDVHGSRITVHLLDFSMSTRQQNDKEVGSNNSDENIGFNGAELSESVLGRDWDSPEEDAAWSNL